MDARIKLEIEDAVAVVTLDRPDKLNALDEEMLDSLREAAAGLERDRTARCVILTGTGRAFCAGGDVAAWSALEPRDFAMRWIRAGHAAFDAFARLRQPLIAVLNGHALGGGLELAACADLRVAERHARLGQPEAALGIVPGWSGTQRAARRFGAGPVRRMALFGETFSAEDALALGLVDHVADSGDGLALAREIAAGVVTRPPLATQIVKMAINAAEGEERDRPLDALAGGWAAGGAELREGLVAFREKRPPRFGAE